MLLDKIFMYMLIYFGLATGIFFFLTFLEAKNNLKNPKMKKHSIISVAVPMYNVSEHVRWTVDSLINLDYPKNFLDIMIIDDGSTDDSLKIAREYEKYDFVRVFSKKNGGKCSAINFALSQAKGDFFAVLDVDGYVTPSALIKMMGYFENPKVMAVTPSLKIFKPKTFLQKIQALEFLLGVYLRKVFGQLGSIHVTPGCFSIYRKSFFDNTGYYHEGNLTEDIEVALRMQTMGYIIENSIDAEVFTMGVSRFKSLYNQRIRWYKGFLDNVVEYKKLFSLKYGNLGMIVLPSALLSIVLSFFLTGKAGYIFFSNWFSNIKLLINTNFDFMQFFKFNFDLFFINLNPVFFLSLVSIIISVTVIYIAVKYSRETGPIVLPFICFSLAYIFLFAFWWVSAIYHKVAGKKIRWGNIYL